MVYKKVKARSPKKQSVTVTVGGSPKGARDRSDEASTKRLQNCDSKSIEAVKDNNSARTKHESSLVITKKSSQYDKSDKNQESAYFGKEKDEQKEKARKDKVWNLQYVYSNPRADGASSS